MYQYILFDLDGTLTDPKSGICTSVQYALSDAGITEENLDVLEPFIGPPLKDSFIEFYHMSEEQAVKAVIKYRERFEETGLYENEIYPGIADMLRTLKAAGMQMGIASSKPTVFVEKILLHFQVKEFFDIVVGSELDGTRGKKEEVVEEALKQLIPSGKKDYDKCVMIGDRRFDIEGAKAHQIDSIGVSYGYGGPEELRCAGATYIVTTVRELQNLLLPTEQKKKRHPFMDSFYKVWQILFPIALYWLISNIVIIAGVVIIQFFMQMKGSMVGSLGWEWTGKMSVYLNTLATFAAIPFMYRIYKNDKIYNKNKRIFIKKENPFILLLTIIMGASAALGCNIALSYIDFSGLSKTYSEVSRVQYSVSIPIGILIYGVITPIAEELVFRGIVFKRIERYFKTTIAIVVSAFIFGMYHGNLVQGIYGFLLGIGIAVCYSYFEDILVPILFHGAANACVFTITQNDTIETMVNKPLNCVLFITIAICTFMQMKKMRRD